MFFSWHHHDSYSYPRDFVKFSQDGPISMLWRCSGCKHVAKIFKKLKKSVLPPTQRLVCRSVETCARSPPVVQCQCTVHGYSRGKHTDHFVHRRPSRYLRLRCACYSAVASALPFAVPAITAYLGGLASPAQSLRVHQEMGGGSGRCG